MIANNAAGMRSVRYGMTIDHVLAMLGFGHGRGAESACPAWKLAAKCTLPDREGDIYRGLSDLIGRHGDEIRTRYPKVIRRSGGYALDALVDADPWNLAN